ncbi:MAG TPA: MFS transporter, partial [Thermomicrobiales bacterium]|nr:MFS transporter [Thermomicrobiales bacterium]
ASLGVVLAATGGGAFLGATLYGAIAGKVSRFTLWLVGFMLVPLEFWVFLLSPGLAVLTAAYVVVGLVMGPINPIMVSLRHERSPRQIRGRVFSTYSAIAMAAQPLGVLVAGNLVEGTGFRTAIVVMAVVAQGVGVASILIPGFRQMDDPPPGIQGLGTNPIAGAVPAAGH